MSRTALFLFAAAAASVTLIRAEGPPSDTVLVVREYVRNDDATNWTLAPGWTWLDGKLTHWPSTAGPTEPSAMPAVTPGKTYRINVTFTGRTKGSVTLALGRTAFANEGADGTYTRLVTPANPADPADPADRLRITPTADYDGSISKISVVELGEELVDTTGWAVPAGWSQIADGFLHTPGGATTLWRPVSVETGHHYQLTFNVGKAPGGPPGVGNGDVFLGYRQFGWFTHEGGWNFSFDFQASGDNRLAFVAQESPGAGTTFNGMIRNVSVREIASDPPPTSQNR